MATVLNQTESVRTVEATRARVAREASVAYGSLNDDPFVVQCAHDAVDELWETRPSVTTFIPLLAMRRVREHVEARGGPPQVPAGVA